MLVLSRKRGEGVVIGHTIRVTVLAIRGKQVRLGFTAPMETLICREEVCRSADSGDRPHSSVTGRVAEGTCGASPGEIGR